MKLSQLKIDPEFQSKIPPLQFEEEQQLEQNIIAEGRLLNPIITWNGYILDGHTRKPSRSWLRKTPAVLQTATCGRFSASITVPAVR